MKTIISILTTMVFALSFGLALADEWPTDKGNLFLGSIPFDEVYPVQATEVRESTMGAAAGGIREEKLDRSAMSWEVLFGHSDSTDVPDPYKGFYKPEVGVGATGAAAGGLRAAAGENKGEKIFDSLFGSHGGTTDIAY